MNLAGQLRGGIVAARQQGTRAFTMIEVAISLGVIAIALVAILGIMPTGLRVQRENREDTIITADGMLLLEAIRSGREVSDRLRPVTTRAPDWPNGSDYLTNYVVAVAITNRVDGTLVFVNPYLTPPNNTGLYPFGRVRGPLNPSVFRRVLTNGVHILGLLGRPKLEIREGVSDVVTNYVSALVRSISGAASEKGTVGRDLAFTYVLTSEVVPLWDAAREWTAYQESGLTATEILTRSNRFRLEVNRSLNFCELRLAIGGPVRESRNPTEGMRWNTYGSPRLFRTVVSGRQFSYAVNPADPEFIVSYFVPAGFQRQ